MNALPWVRTALVAVLVFLLSMLEPVSAQHGPGILISELRFRGLSNTDEFVEIFNPTSAEVPIGGWTIVGSDAMGVTTVRVTVPAGITLNPGCYYLVTHLTGYQGPTPGDATYTASFADSGDVAVVDANGVVSDKVGFPGNLYNEPPTLSPLVGSINQSYERKPGGEDGHVDTNNNYADFRLRSAASTPPEPPNPQNLASPCLDVVEPDVEAPVFDEDPQDVEAEATGPDGAVVTYYVPTATDNVDPQVAVSCEPVSGGVFRLGNTDVLCSAEDAAGNSAAVVFTVRVHDTTPPDVTVPANITREATSPAPQVVTYEASASDAVTVDLLVLCSPASGSPFSLGATNVTCRATDAAGNIGEAFFVVTILDTTAPSMTVPEPVVAEATGPKAPW